MNYVGVDIGGTKCAVILGNQSGQIISKVKFSTEDVTKTLEKIFSAIDELGEFGAIGISCGGPLDTKKGIIMSPPNLPGWDDIHIVDMMKQRYNVPVAIQNDANACALAEWKFGAGKGCNNIVFLTFGTGLGAGIILNGKLYDGTNGMAGEVGHIRIEKSGPVGYGKAGSFEGFCSGGGIAGIGRIKAMEQLQMGKSVSYCKSYEDLDQISAKLIAEYADKGFADAAEVYRECGEKLGYGLSILIDILNPERIVIGSIYQRSEKLLKADMQRIIEKETLFAARAVCEIVPAQLGDEIGDYAALAVAESGLEVECL